MDPGEQLLHPDRLGEEARGTHSLDQPPRLGGPASRQDDDRRAGQQAPDALEEAPAVEATLSGQNCSG